MFGQLFSSLKANRKSGDMASRRQYGRRDCDRCITVIDGKTYPVENWSQGGMLVTADERRFSLNDEVEMTIKFGLRETLLDIPHKARVRRKSNNKVAFEFAPLTQQIRSSFQAVVDDYVASQFAASQRYF